MIFENPPVRQDPVDKTMLLNIADDLASHGWSRQDGFLSGALIRELAAQCQALAAAGALVLAGTGHGGNADGPSRIRGDRIQWLLAGQSAACDRYLRVMEILRIALNRDLYLGLDDYESHFAFYVPGAAYSKHVDRFRDDDRRTLSVVIYLNPGWLPEHGGALRLHPAGEGTTDIAPLASRLVLFLSAGMPHEVLPAIRDRLSLTGWFRRRA